MNFDTKHILKWGIPGWYLIINLAIASSSIYGYEWMHDNSYLTTSVIVTLMGVPLGYVIYQPYFFVSIWAYENRGNQWNLFLIKKKDGEKRNFLSYRYGYFLNNIHGYGSLLSSIIISVLFLVGIACINNFTKEIVILITINIVLAVMVFFNFLHYQKAFTEFVDKVLKDKTLT